MRELIDNGLQINSHSTSATLKRDAGASGFGRKPTVAIVVPTRNERGNVEEFVKRTVEALAGTPIHWEIVFADDSDDDTPDIIDDLTQRGLPVRYVHRQIDERCHSISGAIHTALETIDAEIAVVIDADLQHPPEVLASMIGPLAAGEAQISIGTRYVPAGSADGLRTPWRRWASRACGMAVVAVFPQYRRCTDLSSGLFAFRVEDFRSGRGRIIGFKFLPEVLVRCKPEAIAEIPYVFEDRFGGLSKARLRDGFTLMRALIGLRRDSRRFRAVSLVADPERFRLSGDIDLRDLAD